MQAWGADARFDVCRTNREPTKSGVIGLLALQNPSMLHGAVEQSFEPRTSRALWRLDTLGGQYYLLLLSAERPELSHLVAQFGTGEAPETRDYTPLLERMTPGSVWQFRLHGNPTYSSCTENARGKVHACTLIRRPDKLLPGKREPKTQTDWLIHQGEVHGFAVTEDTFGMKRNQWYNFTKKTGEQVKLLGVTYEGLLTVTDAAKFREALTGGIGRGKAYGLGLLTVVRP